MRVKSACGKHLANTSTQRAVLRACYIGLPYTKEGRSMGETLNPQPEHTYEVGERSLSTNVELGLLAFNAVAPFVAPYVPEVVGKLTGSNESEAPAIIFPAGVHPGDD